MNSNAKKKRVTHSRINTPSMASWISDRSRSAGNVAFTLLIHQINTNTMSCRSHSGRSSRLGHLGVAEHTVQNPECPAVAATSVSTIVVDSNFRLSLLPIVQQRHDNSRWRLQPFHKGCGPGSTSFVFSTTPVSTRI